MNNPFNKQHVLACERGLGLGIQLPVRVALHARELEALHGLGKILARDLAGIQQLDHLFHVLQKRGMC